MQVVIFQGDKYSLITTDNDSILFEDKDGSRYNHPVSTYADTVLNKYIRCVMRDIPDDNLIHDALVNHGEAIK